MELRHLLEAFMRRGTLFFRTVIVFVAAGVLFSALLRDNYTATSKILIAKSFSGEEVLFSFAGSAQGDRKADMDRQVEILKSGPVINEVIKELDLRADKGSLLSADQVLGRIRTKPVWEADIIEVTASSNKQGEAAALANSVARQYVRWVQRLKKEETDNTIAYISSEMERIKAGQQALEKETAAFKKENPKAALSDDLRNKAEKNAEALVEKAKIEAEIKRTTTAGIFGRDADRVAELNRQISVLDKALSRHEEDATGLPGAEKRLYSLVRDGRAYNTLYPMFAHKLNEIKVSEALNTAPVQVVSFAGSERKPVRTKGPLTVLAVLLVAVFAGFIAVFGADYFDQSIRCPEDVICQLGMKFIGRTPRINLPDFNRRNEIVIGAADEYEPLLALLNDISSCIASALPPDRKKTVAFISPIRNDGKSFIAAAFAYSISKAGAKAVVVDADVRTRLQSRIHPDSAGEGLAEALSQGKSALSFVRATSKQQVDVLFAGDTAVYEKTQVFSDREAVRGIISELSGSYSSVIVDCPAADGTPGAVETASSCDAAVMVVPAGVVDKKAVLDATTIMTKAGVKFAGIVLSEIRTGTA